MGQRRAIVTALAVVAASCGRNSGGAAVYSECGTQYAIVNKASTARMESAWKKECEASGAKPVNMFKGARRESTSEES